MTAYSEIINKTVLNAMTDDGFDASFYAPKVHGKISAADRKRTSIATIRTDLTRAANQIAKRAMKEQSEKQIVFGFMELPGAVAVDDEGKKIKFTMALKRIEFAAARKRREADRHGLEISISAMSAVDVVAAPYWDAHPEWTLGQCLEQAAADGVTGAAA